MLCTAHPKSLKSLTVNRTLHRSTSDFPSLDTYNLVLPPSLHTMNMNLPLDVFNTVTVHWSSLTSFTGPFSGSGSFLRFIVEARNLICLKISCIGDAEDSHPGALFVHENLTDLTLTPSCSMSHALDHVSLPHLVNLSIGYDFGSHGVCPLRRRPNWEAIVSRLLDRSQCNLQTFATTTPLPPPAMTPIWRMSSLVSLCLFLPSPDTLNHTATVLETLTVTPSQQPLPRLRSLTIICDTDVAHLFTDSKLMDLIASRWEVPKEVQRLAVLSLVNYSCPESLDMIAYEALPLALFLLDLEDNGLEVSWVMGRVVDVLKDARKARESYF
ncbi:hypothetical protein BDZ89DRAFT_1143929 [Hymenopellis radicata]|nr:hypothetical protein BDZ89DRAFT_1143929 [Hymenopellis radicata]